MTAFLTNPAGWTAEVLVDQLKKIRDASNTEGNKLWANNVTLQRLWDDSARIVDPARRELERNILQAIGTQQAAAVTRYTQFKTAWKKAIDGASAFLRGLGVTVPTGLSAGVLVPVAIATALVVAGAFIGGMVVYNANTSKLLAVRSKVLAQVFAGELSTADALALLRAVEKGLDKPPDPLGLTEALKAALPLVAIIAAAMLLPNVLGTLRQGRGRRIAA